MRDSPETKAIRDRMEVVRRDLDTGLQGIVSDARDIGDWTYYVKQYPWAVLGVSLVAGYLIAPRLGFRRHSQATPADGASGSNASNAPAANVGVVGQVMSLVGRQVMQGITAFVLQRAEKLFSAKADNSGKDDHP